MYQGLKDLQTSLKCAKEWVKCGEENAELVEDFLAENMMFVRVSSAENF